MAPAFLTGAPFLFAFLFALRPIRFHFRGLRFSLRGRKSSASFLCRRGCCNTGDCVLWRTAAPLDRSLQGFDGSVQTIAIPDEESNDGIPGHARILTLT